jgi:hypothetical protein
MREYRIQRQTLVAILENDDQSAVRLLKDLDTDQLQDLADACTRLARLCAEAFWQAAAAQWRSKP